MQNCPNCGATLNGSLQRDSTTTEQSPGQKGATSELLNCPDCGEIVDGFSPH